jgi:hypothetical protein
MRKIFFISFCSLFITLGLGCEKDENISKNQSLHNVSIDKIKNLMLGKWQIHYSDGGFAGYTPCNGCFWEITPSDTLIQTYNGSQYGKNKIRYIKNVDDDWSMTNDGSIGTVNYILYRLKNDTLVAGYEGTSIISYLTKL